MASNQDLFGDDLTVQDFEDVMEQIEKMDAEHQPHCDDDVDSLRTQRASGSTGGVDSAISGEGTFLRPQQFAADDPTYCSIAEDPEDGAGRETAGDSAEISLRGLRLRIPAISGLHDAGVTRIIHSVYVGSRRELVQAVNLLVKRISVYFFMLVAFHECAEKSHLHVVHGCRWPASPRRCGCPGFLEIKRLKIPGSKVRKLYEYTDQSFSHLFQYFGKGRRTLVAVSSQGGGYWDLSHIDYWRSEHN